MAVLFCGDLLEIILLVREALARHLTDKVARVQDLNYTESVKIENELVAVLIQQSAHTYAAGNALLSMNEQCGVDWMNNVGTTIQLLTGKGLEPSNLLFVIMADHTVGSSDCVTIYETTFTRIIDGQLGSEGPVFIPGNDDVNIYMVAPEVEVDGKPAGQIVKVDLRLKETEVVCLPSEDGYGGIPAGCQVGKDGLLWVADMRLGLLKVNVIDKSWTQVCQHDESMRAMQGCNDCSYDYRGNLWLTAPAGSIAPAPYTRSMKEPFGSIYCYTSSKTMKRIDTGYMFPNGIAVQHDEQGDPVCLIVAETGTKSLWSIPYDKSSPLGLVEVGAKQIFGHCPGHHEGGPDGMDFDHAGNLLVANWGSGFIDVFDTSGGSPHTRIKLPFSRVSNLHFKPNSNKVYVTEHDTHGLWEFEWIHKGAKQYCDL